jgi:serine/threonine-protein kinase RsbW
MVATSGGSTETLRLPCEPHSVPVARRRVQDSLSRRGIPVEAVEDARIVVSELVGNSVRHGRPLCDGTIIVAWRIVDTVVELCVTDGGADTQPRLVHAPATSPSGRGIAILDVLADEWWLERTPERSTVHARLSV